MLKFKGMPIRLSARQTRNHILLWSVWAGKSKALVVKYDDKWTFIKAEVVKFKHRQQKWCSTGLVLNENEYRQIPKDAKMKYASYLPEFIRNITKIEGDL